MPATRKNQRRCGIALPLSAARSAHDDGCGTFNDLPGLGAWAANAGVSIIQLLPVNDSGSHASPYFSLSAFALSPMYLDLDDLPAVRDGAGRVPAFSKARKSLHAALAKSGLASVGRLDYGLVYGAKRACAFAAYEAEVKAEVKHDPKIADTASVFADWIGANPWCKPYAVFKVLKDDRGGKHWREWEPEWREPGDGAIEAAVKDPVLADRIRFELWLQFHLDRQLRAAKAGLEKLGIWLKGDLPILLNDDSADCWHSPELFLPGLRAGSPPDGENPEGQDWGFPPYDWDAHAEDDFAFWKARLSQASRYFHAYRIDHVLGFFRMWVVPDREASAARGFFLPGALLHARQLNAIGFTPERLRWLSLPHLPEDEIFRAGEEAGMDRASIQSVIDKALDRVGSEALYLFKEWIAGERDIASLGDVPPRFAAYLRAAWRDRCLEPEPDAASPRGADAWTPARNYWNSRAWASLSSGERSSLESAFRQWHARQEAIWGENGRYLLSSLGDSTEMLACAEDLGAVPACVPPVLDKLGILGLRVLRWTRAWDRPGSPFVSLKEYPEKSVFTTSVHDSPSLRRWWEEGQSKDALLDMLDSCVAGAGEKNDIAWIRARKDDDSPELFGKLLALLATTRSRYFILPMQDWLAMSATAKRLDAEAERVNVPGTVNGFNWSWRMPMDLSELSANETRLAEDMLEISETHRKG